MILSAAARTDVGLKRSANEDSFALAPDLGLFVVADGMGGHTAGKLASALASEGAVCALRQVAGSNASPTEKLRYCVAAANRKIFETAQAKPELAGMGTTFVALLAGRGRIALAHVGDSRAYLIRGGVIRRLTDDHSLVAELVRRHEISERDAREHPHRHVLTRALGVRRAVEADLAEMTPALDDVVVLCSDGLTGHLHDDEIAEIVLRNAELDAACARLIELANARGGDDNTTV
ncbi:MAG: Stp1/IreP family PP2C-type Ser/Thr phosphatase, partial [Myxococcales bacterium]|nr:Stp1/IreP family PP2C-type Ser/Thr phosphatase [Myxococcales bacterium]